MADDVWTKDNVLSGLATKEQIDTLIQTNREVKSLLSDFMSFYRRDNWVEKISLRNEPQMLPLNGYRHIGIWVSEIDLPMTVNIGLPGIQSTSVELVAGLNALPDIDGMFISGSVGQIANVVRSNDPLTVSAATVLGQQGTLTNPVIIEQTGRLVGLPQPTAVTVFSIPYSALTASTTYSAMAQKSLTRAVRQRTFYWTNDTNQPMSSASIKIVDSEFAGGSSNPGYWTEVPFTAIPGAGTYGPYPAIADSLSLPALGVMGDSVIVSFAVGATLPTSGSIVIAVLEG